MGEVITSPSAGSSGLRFPLARRLKQRRLIEPLFDRSNPDSHSVRSGCIRILYRLIPAADLGAPFQVGVAVGRSRGHAPRRNRVKRIMRDVLRNEQEQLNRIATASGNALTAMMLFQGRDEDGPRIREDLAKALVRLEERVQDAASSPL